MNLEAAEALTLQLRLRALSGLIVVDFLELQAVAKRKGLVADLRKALKTDPEPTRVFPMSPSGLVEMTRRRGRPALHELLTEPCGLGGLGRVKDPVTLAYEALRKVPSVSAARPGAAIAIEASARVVDALSGPLAEAPAQHRNAPWPASCADCQRYRGGTARRCPGRVALSPGFR